MPKIKLTKSKIDSIKNTEKGQVIYWDTETPGFGLVVGLRAKAFCIQIDVKDASKPKGHRTVKRTLGRYGTELTLEQAKERLSGYVDRDTGDVVMGERLKLKQDIAVTPAKGKDKTLKALIDEYYRLTKRRDGKDRKPGTAAQYTALVQRHYSGWMDLLLPEIATITPDVVLEKYRENECEFGKATSRNSSSVLISVLKYGSATYPKALTANPMAILSNPYLCVRQAKLARHECLIYDPAKKRNDFPGFFNGIQSCTDIVRDGFLFTLYTGMRRSEVEKLLWSNIDMDHKELLVCDTKNRQNLHIPLNRQAMDVLTRRNAVTASDFIFSQARSGGKNRTGHIQLNSLTLKSKTGLDLTVHALRRTFENIGRNKLKRHADTSKLTNHIDSSVEGKHYDEVVIADLRETSQMIGDTIERYMKETTSNVIQFPGSQAA
jgi:integrase